MLGNGETPAYDRLMAITRCSLGLHRWVTTKRRADDHEEITVCSDCGRESGSGVLSVVLFGGGLAIGAVAVFFLFSPFLGAIMMIGAIAGLGWGVMPMVFERIGRWLSIGRW